MQFRQATAFIASTAFFLPANVNASLLRHGVDGEFEVGDTIEITEDRPGTFLRALIEYEDSSHDGPDETLNIMVDDNIYELDDADEELKVFESGEKVTIPAGVTLGTKSGKAKTNGAKIKSPEGGKKGKKKENIFGRNLEGRTEEQQRNVDQLRRHLSSTTLGDKSVVAVRVQTTDAVYSNSEAILRREVFGIGEGGDQFNLASGYDQCSYGSLTFSPLASQSSSDPGVSIDNGVVTISVDVAAGGNSDGTVRNAVTNKIREIFGSNMQSVADYWMYCLPPGTSGGWIAYAYINSYISVYNNNWCNYPSGQMHELGHNLGFAHSGEGTQQYADQSGMMGYSYSSDEGPVMCFNAAKSWQTGWYGPEGAHGDKTLEYSSGDGCLVETLSGIADYDTTSNKVLIKVVNPFDNGADIFVAFNAKKDINSGTVEAGNLVTVVQVDAGGGLVYSKSTLLGKLGSGASYNNANFGGESLTVEVVSISGSDSADVKIYFGSACVVTPPPAPTNPPTPMPTKVGQSGPQSASYDSALGAPKCSFGSSCDSEGLLNGRGNMNGGNEPNQPNTLNSCTDGSQGNYHVDESIDKIVVTQTSGSGNDFTEGDDVTISATVWCYNSGDYIDFYYASDASSPVWNLIGVRQQCPSAGEQIFSASYTLPQGSIQAVRANLMWNSGTASAASCTTGSYDDTDDLVITVKPNQPAPPTSPPTPPPTANPTPNPTPQPSNPPTPVPSNPPTSQPTPNPTSPPTPQPSNPPTTAQPTKAPTPLPTPVPTNPPTAPPTANPTAAPTNAPSAPPTPAPSNPPTVQPTPNPTSPPTPQPSNSPTTAPPTKAPTPLSTPVPTNPPTAPPTANPTAAPTNAPSAPPTNPPTAPPTTPPTPNPTVPVTPQPTSGDDAVAQEAVYDSEYGVPRCANAGSSCDSLTLLDGKGSMTNGQELNASNTNKFGQACTDGNGGSYHSDESIDQITVTAGDLDAVGNPVPSGDFIVEGGRAYVTVKLWCWSSGASDHADLFLSSDASSPDWQSLTTITCPGGGAQTIRHAFDVPSGANQSIRVNFRYGGSPSTCSSGFFDDHDDLIFAVKPGSGTPPPTPAPVASPPTGGPSGPQTAYFDSGLGAPKCSYGSRCDSVGLLNGRGTINNGIELNRPNTLNTCNDGNYGSYHSDESIDNIVVSRTDGGTGDFTEGDEVTITANIWCWNTGSSDYIDFYYASNAANPVWSQIGVRQVCPGGQSQTVSRNFILPQGGLQAVRVNLMYGSGNPGTNKCTSGVYDETDDLVISVKPNAIAAGMALPSKHDDVQGAIVDSWKDPEADEAAKELQEMNASTEKPKLKGKSKAGKEKGKGAEKKLRGTGLWQ